MIFACDCGDFARPGPCLAESLFFIPGGPVAAVAAATESHPLTNSYSILSLLKNLGGSEKRIGPLWLRAQQEAAKLRNFLAERILRDVEGSLEEKINVDKLRRDQALMYCLLGDPATRLKLPEALEVAVEYRDGAWHWRATRPAGATSLEIGLRASNPARPAPAVGGDRKKALAALRAANATFEFCPTGTLNADAPWTGTVRTEGTLRLVATSPQRIHAATVELKSPATGPAGAEAAAPAASMKK